MIARVVVILSLMGCLLACYPKDEIVPTMSPTPEYVTSQELRAFEERLNRHGFSDQQRRDIAVIVAESFEQYMPVPATPIPDGEQIFLTAPIEQALLNAGYSSEEVLAIVSVMHATGYINPDNPDRLNSPEPTIDITRLMEDQSKLIETQIAKVLADGTLVYIEAKATVKAESTIVAKATQNATCIISNTKYSDVGIREQPNTNAHTARYLFKGEKRNVIGHNGGVLNETLWWQVRITNYHGEDIVGWVSSNSVEELTLQACLQLPTFP